MSVFGKINIDVLEKEFGRIQTEEIIITNERIDRIKQRHPIWAVSTATFSTGQDIGAAVFAAITQGILAAGLSTYVNQILKQLNKKE